MFQGKKCLEKFIENTNSKLENDPLKFIFSDFVLSDEEKKYMVYDNFPDSEMVFTIPDIVDYFIGNIRGRISNEMFSYYNYMEIFKKIITQLNLILKSPDKKSEKLYSAMRQLLNDLESEFQLCIKTYRNRNNGIRKNRKTDKTYFQKKVDEQNQIYLQKCQQFETYLVKVILTVPSTELKKLVDILRGGIDHLTSVYDLELEANLNSKGKIPIFYIPERIVDLKSVISDYMKPILFQLSTARKRSLMYKPPNINFSQIVDTYKELVELFPYFSELESRIKPDPVSKKRKLLVTIFPTGKMSSPYTRAVTSKGKETRMCYGFYYHPTNVIVLSGTADEMIEENEPSEIMRVFFEYIFDTMSQNSEYIRDPIGINKEKGNYYSVIKKKLSPELSEILKDTLDLRYHFSFDLCRFVSVMKEDGKFKIEPELFNWFMTNLVDPDYVMVKKSDTNDSKGIFGFFK